MWNIPACPFPRIETFQTPAKGVRLDLGCGDKPAAGFYAADICSPKADLLFDLSRGIPVRDASISFLRASHLLEHIPDLQRFMDECWRVLSEHPAAGIFIAVPRADHINAVGDPEHVRFFTPNTFVYFTPYWHYKTRQKPWEIAAICWCEESEIKAVMRPIRDEAKVKQMDDYRKKVAQEQNGATCHLY